MRGENKEGTNDKKEGRKDDKIKYYLPMTLPKQKHTKQNTAHTKGIEKFLQNVGVIGRAVGKALFRFRRNMHAHGKGAQK